MDGVMKMREFVLFDGAESTNALRGIVGESPNGSLVISVEGYGDSASVDGAGHPILLELYEGKLRLHVWADINKEDPTHTIELEGARESAREDD